VSSTSRHSRARRATAAFAASALSLGGAYALLGAGTGVASSHREAPQILNDPTADNTDTYAFVSPDDPDTVTLIANWLPFQEPAGGPNFYPWATEDQAHYNIKIDNNGDAVPDITYRWTFQTQDTRGEVDYEDPAPDGTFLYNNGPVTALDDPTLLFKQTYTLTAIAEDGSETVLVEGADVAPSRVGDASMPDYEALRDQAIVDVEGGGQSFVGQADDPFFLDLRVFDLLYGGDLSERGNDTLDGFNVNSVALQVPISDVTTGDDPVIGVWSTTDRASMRVQNADGSQEYSGDFVQVSRLGNPLVNEVVIPANLKDAFNALAPQNDASVEPAVNKVLYPEVPILLQAIYGLEPKETPRDDLFTIFLTGLEGLNKPAGEVQPAELLRLNTSIPPSGEENRLGVLAGDNAGFPNGRRLGDDVVDIALQAVAGAVSVSEQGGAPTGVEIVDALAEGDKVNENDKEFGESFPYLALPHSGSSVDGGGSPKGGVDAGAGGTAADLSSASLPGEEGTSPVLPLAAAALGLGFAGMGIAVLRRNRVTAGR
jgi:hypothetical protein